MLVAHEGKFTDLFQIAFRFLLSTNCDLFQQAYANDVEDENQFKRDVLKLQEIIIIDFSKANQKIQELEETHRNIKNPMLTDLFSLTKIRFNSSYGNYARVQFEINKARRLLFHFKPTHLERLYLELFGAMYENAEPNLDSIIRAANRGDKRG